MDKIVDLYSELEWHLLTDEAPSIYMEEIYYHPLMKHYPLSMLYTLKDAPQSPKHHPEGNVWNHTLLVIDMAAKMKCHSKSEKVFMWAALLHDIGKPPTTKIKKGRIISYDHDKIGAKMAEEFLSFFMDDTKFIRDVCMLVYYHMHILYVTKKLSYADLEGLKKNTDIEEITLLGFCDRMGRTNADMEAEKENIEKFKHIVNS